MASRNLSGIARVWKSVVQSGGRYSSLHASCREHTLTPLSRYHSPFDAFHTPYSWRPPSLIHVQAPAKLGNIIISQRLFSGAATSGVLLGQKSPTPSLQALVAEGRRYAACYYQLSKFRLSGLVVATAAAGYVMGSGDVVNWEGLGWTSLGTMMAAASANAFNQIIEIGNDAQMKRTRQRPLPSGRMSRGHAIAFAVSMGISGVAILACKTNELTAELGATNIALYALVYTPLKQVHMVNTWVGAVVGAIPPLMGWAAAASQLDPGSWVLASVLYFWQLPHFMALAWLCRNDYAAGGYKMMSLVDATGRRVAAVSLRNSLYLIPLGFAASQMGITSSPFAWESLALAVAMAAAGTRFYQSPTSASARTLFRSSLLYLPLLMGAMLVHRLPNPNIEARRIAKEQEEEEWRMISTRRVEERSEEACLWQESVDVFGGLDNSLPKREKLPLPPVAFFSAAPFPFLPVPEYVQREAY